MRELAYAVDDGEVATELTADARDAHAYARTYLARPEHVLRGSARDVVGAALGALPPEARAWLRARAAPVVFVCPVVVPGEVAIVGEPVAAGTALVALHPVVLGSSYARAVVVAELARVFVHDHDSGASVTPLDLAADAVAHAWGFGAELLAAYEAELALRVTTASREPYRRRIAALRALGDHGAEPRG